LKTLIIRAGALGDTLMLMPSVYGLKKDTETIIAGRRPGIDYLRPYTSQCIDIESMGMHRLFMDNTDDLKGVHFPHCDHVIAFLNDPDGHLKRNLSACFPGTPVHIFPVFPLEGDETHTALYMARAIQKAGLPIDADKAFKDSMRIPLINLAGTASVEKRHIVIHPGSGSVKKNYSPDFWVQVIRELQRRVPEAQRSLIMLLGPAEEHLSGFFKDNLTKRGVELKVLPEREEVLSILSGAAVYIGHDSGITHLAAMMGIRVIALYKTSSFHAWRPLGPNVRIITSSLPDNSLL